LESSPGLGSLYLTGYYSNKQLLVNSIENVTFRDNLAFSGSAIYLEDSYLVMIKVKLFKNNASYDSVIKLSEFDLPTVISFQSCEFQANTAESGLIEVHQGGVVFIENCFFFENFPKKFLSGSRGQRADKNPKL
jgi:hypothetical protein